MVKLEAHTSSGTMALHVEVDFYAPDLETALLRIRQAVGDAAPIFVDPSAGTNTLRRDG
jgi:hypothetical protein